MGRWLRDEVLDVCERSARRVWPDVPRASALPTARWKLEYVLGRLHGAAGETALNVLDVLRVEVPNEAHMLCAGVLAMGGTLATVNLDNGVELGYALLRGELSLPKHAQSKFALALLRWQEALPSLPPLDVLTRNADFVRWSQHRSQPVLAKFHGSIAPVTGNRPVEPVISDFVELTPLSATKRNVMEWVLSRDVLVTGYAGGDGDTYTPLLSGLRPEHFRWLDPRPPERIKQDIGALDPRQPETGTAVDGLRSHPALKGLPRWPGIDLGADARIARQLASWRAQIDHLDAADAYAWMLLDAREHQASAELSRILWRMTRRRRALRRLADAHYHYGGIASKNVAARMYLHLLRPGSCESGLRTYALQRLGETQRGRAIQGPHGSRTSLLAATVAPTAAWLLSWPDRAGPQARTSALGSLAHLALRVLEARMATSTHHRARLVLLAMLARYATGGHTDTTGGHGHIYTEVQLAELQALRTLLRRNPSSTQRKTATRLHKELMTIESTYRDMNNPMGEANARGAQALAAAASGNHKAALNHLDDALLAYDLGNRIDPSGQALVDRRRAIIALWA
jgi:hypothetical protein